MAFPEVTIFSQVWVSVMGKQEIPFRVIHPHAAGIDVGSRSHMVAIEQLKVCVSLECILKITSS